MNHTEVLARRARLGIAPPQRVIPPRITAERLHIYDEPIGPPHITDPHERMDFIVGGMARFYGVLVARIMSGIRTPKVVDARHSAMHLVKASTTWGVTEIGRLFGRDHATVNHALKRVARQNAPKQMGPEKVARARVWDWERVKQVEAMWLEGQSAGQIAKTIGGGLTKNAVLGKLFRRGLVGIERPRRKGAEARFTK